MSTRNIWDVSSLVPVERDVKISQRDDFAIIYDLFGVYLPENIKDLFKFFGWGGRFCSELRLFPGDIYTDTFENAAKRAREYSRLSITKLLDFVEKDSWVLDKYHGEKINYESLFLFAKTSWADDFYLNIHDDNSFSVLGVEDDGYVYNMGSLNDFLVEYLGNKSSNFRRGVGLDWSFEIGIPVSIRESDLRLGVR